MFNWGYGLVVTNVFLKDQACFTMVEEKSVSIILKAIFLILPFQSKFQINTNFPIII